MVTASATFENRNGFLLKGYGTTVNGLSKALVLKDKQTGEIFAALMHAYSADGRAPQDFGYRDVPQDFTGLIFYSGLSGEFVNGHYYVQGKISKTARKGSTGSVSPSQARSSCSYVPMEKYSGWVCVYDYCSYKYTSTTYVYLCDYTEDTEQDTDDGGYEGTNNGGSVSFDPNNEALTVRGDKPKSEHNNKCAGIQDMWNSYPNNEVSGYITRDGSLLVIDVLPLYGGSTWGTYFHGGTTYYVYPTSQGAPTYNYSGMQISNGNYYIPVIASVHTHTPCRTDGTNGVSHPVGSDDRARAAASPYISHWVIGCGAIAQYNSSSTNFINVQSGNLANTCGSIH